MTSAYSDILSYASLTNRLSRNIVAPKHLIFYPTPIQLHSKTIDTVGIQRTTYLSGRGFLFFFTEKYIQFEDWINQCLKNIFSMEIVTFPTGKVFSPRSLALLPREKYFHHGDCHFYQGKRILTTVIVTFLMVIIFLPWSLALLPGEKYYHHGDCTFYHGKRIFSTVIVTFLMVIIFLPWSLALLPWSLLQCCRLMIK